MSAHRSNDAAFRPDLEGARGIAVLLVLLFHAEVPAVSGGFIGVDVFYVLSGFLITGILTRELAGSGTLDFKRFYARRMRRLLPAGLVVIVATLIASLFILSPLQFPSVALDGAASALYVSNIRYAAGSLDYLAVTDPSPLLHYWSLAVEEQFYLLWPLLLWFSWKVGGRRALWVMLLGTSIASFVFSIWLTGVSAPLAFFLLMPRAWQLGAGAIVALSVPWLMRLPLRAAAAGAIAGVVVIVGGAFVISPDEPYPGWAAVIPVVGAVLLIAAGCRGSGRTGPSAWLGKEPLAFLGRVSYSVYLWHWPLVVLGVIVLDTNDLAVRLVLVFLAVPIAAVQTKVLEDPIRFSKMLPARPSRSIMGGLGASVAVAIAAILMIVPSLASSEPAATPDPGIAAASPSPSPDLGLSLGLPGTKKTPRPDPTPAASAISAGQATPEPTAAPTPEPTQAPTPEPTPVVTAVPTVAPTPEPTPIPTPAPTAAPTLAPTVAPTPVPTAVPTPSPAITSLAPTLAPTPVTTPVPSVVPSVTAAPVATPVPTPVPTPEPVVTPMPSVAPATAAPTPEPVVSVAPGTPAPATPAPTPEPVVSVAPSVAPATPAPSPAPVVTAAPTPAPAVTASPQAIATPAPTPTPAPATPAPTPRPHATAVALVAATPKPTPAPTPPPTPAPTPALTPAPTPEPVVTPAPTPFAIPSPVASLPPGTLNSGPLPDELVKKLKNVRDDLPPVYADGCQLDFATTKSPPCVYGDDKGETTIVLFGDSHAAQWVPALDAIAKASGARLVSLTKSGCPFEAITVWNAPQKRVYDECDTWRKNALERIEKENPALIFVASARLYTVVQDGKRVSEERSMRLQVDGEAAMAKRLLDPERRVILLRDAPVYPEDPVECLARRKNLNKCVIDHATAFAAVEQDQAQELSSEVIVLDPRPVVCPSDPCPLVMDDRLMYRDQHHLTASYVKSLAPWLRDELLAALQAPEASPAPASPEPSPSGAP